MVPAMRYVGVDACRAGWFAVLLGGDGPEFRVCESFAEVWAWAGQGARLFVDIPVGLPAEGTRRADREARQALPAHLKSTLFNTPVRRAVYAESKEEARRINRQLSGKSLSEQSLGIMKKLRMSILFAGAPGGSARRVRSPPRDLFRAVGGSFPGAWEKRPARRHGKVQDH